MHQLKKDIFAVGVGNPTMRVFDIIMQTEYGTTYNAYLIKDERPTLVETVHERFTDAYFAKIAEICPIKDIQYIVFNHTEPDHSGSLRRLLEQNPGITVVGSSAAIKNLTDITRRPFRSITARDGDTLDIGRRTLKFISAPNLHWPDSMFTYSEADRAVFTCDFLGAHYCEEALVDRSLAYPEKYAGAFRSYYDAIFSPFKRFVLAGLDKLEALDFDTVCTSHGPVLTETWKRAAALYRQWSAPAPKAGKTAAVVYVSAYGYTKRLAKAAEEALAEKGYAVRSFDLVEGPADIAAAMDADLLLIGSPTINRDALKPVWDFVSSLDAVNLSGKRCLVFGSYGWSGEAVPMLCKRLSELKLKVDGEGFRVRFNPSDEDVNALRARVAALADAV